MSASDIALVPANTAAGARALDSCRVPGFRDATHKRAWLLPRDAFRILRGDLR